ncbi:MBL fold metallo-hydrolase [Streptomyces asiaticus]|uniref:MBL fold metallo-hydrolase n=1 Tax=Streptomyces asiaticus TaxID=114695 RepID=UPI003D714331
MTHQSSQLQLVTLGTAAGRIWPDPGRSGTSTVLCVGEHHYVVDVGYGWGQRYHQYGLGTGFGLTPLRNLRAVFLTHLHSDHTIGLAELLTYGLEPREEPILVMGPGSRGTPPPTHGSVAGHNVPLVHPERPLPGTVDMVRMLQAAFAADLNDNVRDSGKPHPDSVLRASDVRLPASVIAAVGDPDVNPAPIIEPFAVHEDDDVRVSATLVDHRPVFPALAFRFDTAAGSVTFSGDTCVSENLVRLARDTDVLVHEANDVDFIEQFLPEPRTPAQQAKLDHLRAAHTSPIEAGQVAQAAEAGTLVLTHLGRCDPAAPPWDMAATTFAGRVVVAEEGMRLSVGNREEIHQ